MIIGDNFYIGKDSQIECDTIISHNVIFGNKMGVVGKYDHHFQKPGVTICLAPRISDAHYNWKGLELTTVIEDDVWVGNGSIIMGGIKFGKGCIIAAGICCYQEYKALYMEVILLDHLYHFLIPKKIFRTFETGKGISKKT